MLATKPHTHALPDPDAVRLRRHGLRATAPRLAILAMLSEVGGHRSADELVVVLRRAGYPHARTTVYNALEDMARAGLVHAAPVDAGALRYEADGPPHQHFVCRRCGLIRNVEMPDIPVGGDLPMVDGVEIDAVDVVYRGLCQGCAIAASAGVAAAEGADPTP